MMQIERNCSYNTPSFGRKLTVSPAIKQFGFNAVKQMNLAADSLMEMAGVDIFVKPYLGGAINKNALDITIVPEQEMTKNPFKKLKQAILLKFLLPKANIKVPVYHKDFSHETIVKMAMQIKEELARAEFSNDELKTFDDIHDLNNSMDELQKKLKK
jgi:hypothetical protein